MRKYYELGYEVRDEPPPKGYKDYNEWLVKKKKELEKSVTVLDLQKEKCHQL